MDDNFNPGERVAATGGLRGAYDGSDFSTGPDFGDTSWMKEGFGLQGQKSYDLDQLSSIFDLTGKYAGSDSWGLGLNTLKNQNLNPELNWLSGKENFDRGDFTAGEDGNYSGFAGGDFRKTLADLYGDKGITVSKAYNLKDPTQAQYAYKDSSGKLLNTHTSNSHDEHGVWGALEDYAPMAAKTAIMAGVGSALPGFGSSLLGQLGAGALRAGVGGAVGGAMSGNGFNFDLGNIATSAAANAIPGMDVSQFGDFGGYSDMINKSLRGAAMGGIRGGSDGALLGAASPLVQKGFDTAGDALSGGGNNVWENDSFGSGNYSQVPSTLDNVFSQNGIGGMQQGPMSTNAPTQQSGNGLDWQSILSGQQGFGNTDPQQGQGQEYGPNAFGLGMDFGQGQNMPGFNIPAQTPTSAGLDDDFINKNRDLLGGLGDGVKAALIASNPKYAMLFGQQKMSPVGAGVGALASLFYNQKANSQLKKQANNMNLGQDSSYMKAMRQQLDRRDAAGGRRSQYGPREVELQAKLAEMNQRNAPTQFAIAQQRNMNNARTLQDLIGFGKQSGAFDAIGSGLQGLFKG